MNITSDPFQDRMGLWSRKCHRFLIAGPFNFQRSAIRRAGFAHPSRRACPKRSRGDLYLSRNCRANGEHYFGTTNFFTFRTTLSGACASISTMPSR